MKPELQLQYLDEWMLRWRKFQTESDWHIEKNRQWWRRADIVLSGLTFGALGLYTSGTATLRRQLGAPHFFDMGLDSKIKQSVFETVTSRRRYTPQGYGRLLFIGVPTYLTFITLEHYQERRRYRAYLEQDTVFGEQARRLLATGKIEEYLPVNIQATIPKSEVSVYA